jgi:hypothetical protein
MTTKHNHRFRDQAIRGAARVVETTQRALLSKTSPPKAEPSEASPDRDGHGDLQEQLLRFEGSYSSRLMAAFRPLTRAGPPDLRLQAMTDQIGYLSAALDIATGGSPVLDLLDMVTLVALGRDAMASYWKANAEPERARDIQAAFDASLDDIRAVARSMLPPDLENELFAVIHQWQKEHPNERQVVIVRLSDYTGPTFAASDSLEKRASGLLTLVRRVTRTADNTFLLGRRALFAAQRLPFLFRMQVQLATTDALLGAQRTVAEATSDSLPRVQSTVTDATREALTEVRGLLPDVEGVAKRIADDVFLKLVVSGSVLAAFSAAAWLVARLSYARLARR